MSNIQDVMHMVPLLPEIADGAMNASNNFISATINSLVMILVTEIGDKTFFIAAVLAMRNGRLVVYAGAMGALAIMHLLSSLMGFALPALLPRTYTHFASAILFLYFGLKLLKDSYEMKGEGPSDELQEVEEELVTKKGDGNEEDDEAVDIEAAGASNKTKKVPTEVSESTKGKGFFQSFETETLKVFTQAFTLTFLAEWGDRSQIATIALASSKNVFGVVLGGLVGHAFCTGLAVIGGRMLAARISEKTVATVGGLLFVFFAVTSFLWGPDSS